MPKPAGKQGTRRALLGAIAGAACLAGTGCAMSGPASRRSFVRLPDVPFESTPMDVVAAMLRLADVKPSDTVFDLGCGDGRIVMAAARFHGARGVCVDVDLHLIVEGRQNAVQAQLYDRILFLNQDLFETDIADATVVMLFLSREMNLKLRPKLLRELRPGIRIVSHGYDMGDWQPREVVRMTSEGKERLLYLWVVEGGGRDTVIAGVKTP